MRIYHTEENTINTKMKFFFVLCCSVAACYAQISGDNIDSIEDADINAALLNVLNTYDFDNEVAIGLANYGPNSSFSNARIYIDNCCNQALPGTIAAGQTGLVLFGSNELTGPEGIICMDISGTSHMVCTAYSVPFNDALSDEAFNVKIYPTTVPVDEDMWEQMYDDAGGVWNPNEGGTRTRLDYGISITASMTTGDSCSMVVRVDTTNYDPAADPYLAYGCEYRPFDGDYCWRECHEVPPLGYCWLAQTCSSDDACGSFIDPDTYPCDSECIEIVV